MFSIAEVFQNFLRRLRTGDFDMERFPGFRFHPTDEELISYYLKNKIDGHERSVNVIPEVDIYKFEPWDLPAKSIIQTVDHEWFFFTPRGKKYPKGSKTNRATKAGYWKATGKERTIKKGSTLIGMKRTLVFHKGRAPKGERTNWVMHEYCVKGDELAGPQDSFVLCRLWNKHESHKENGSPDNELVGQRCIPPIVTKATLQTAAQAGDNMQQSCTELLDRQNGTECYLGKSICGLESALVLPESVQHLGSDISDKDLERKHEEDCFADVMKDDIVNLENFTHITNNGTFSSDNLSPCGNSITSPETEEVIGIERKGRQPMHMNPSRELPYQGTARRRLRLGVERVSHTKMERKSVSVELLVQHDLAMPGEGLKRKCLLRMVDSRSIVKLVLYMAFLVLLVVFLNLLLNYPLPGSTIFL